MRASTFTEARTKIEHVMLERLHLVNEGSIDYGVCLNAKFDTYLASFCDAMVCRLSSYIAAQNVKKVECRYPETWWDAVKLRFFPKWALKYFPVRMRVTELDAKLIYPTLSLPEPKQWFMTTQTLGYDYPEKEEIE